MRVLLTALFTATTLSVAGCGTSDRSAEADSPRAGETETSQATPTPAMTPLTAGKALKSQIPAVTKLVRIDENNDPNDLLGRPNGYTAATVVFDQRVQCSDGLGADCGATIEQWPDKAAAQRRQKYIQSILKDSPILGSEYDYVTGKLLLRVSGDLKPSQAKAYEAAFRSAQ